jgi:hypothetical protein
MRLPLTYFDEATSVADYLADREGLNGAAREIFLRLGARERNGRRRRRRDDRDGARPAYGPDVWPFGIPILAMTLFLLVWYMIRLCVFRWIERAAREKR